MLTNKHTKGASMLTKKQRENVNKLKSKGSMLSTKQKRENVS